MLFKGGKTIPMSELYTDGVDSKNMLTNYS